MASCWDFWDESTFGSLVMSADGSLLYEVPFPTTYDIYDWEFGVTKSYLSTVNTEPDIMAMTGEIPDLPNGGGWDTIHPGTGKMYAFVAWHLPAQDILASLYRWDVADGANIEELQQFTEIPSSIQEQHGGSLAWHPSTPELVWVLRCVNGSVDICSWDTSTDALTVHHSNIYPGTGDTRLSQNGVWQYDRGLVFLILGDSIGYRSVAYDIATDTFDTSPVSGSTPDQFPTGVTYDGRLLVIDNDLSPPAKVHWFQPITVAGSVSIGALQPYTDCDIFYDELFEFYDLLSYWFAPADRRSIFMSGTHLYRNHPQLGGAATWGRVGWPGGRPSAWPR